MDLVEWKPLKNIESILNTVNNSNKKAWDFEKSSRQTNKGYVKFTGIAEFFGNVNYSN